VNRGNRFETPDGVADSLGDIIGDKMPLVSILRQERLIFLQPMEKKNYLGHLRKWKGVELKLRVMVQMKKDRLGE
jgi:hypothetical protein